MAEVGQNHPAARRVVSGHARKLLHQVGVRQPVKTVPLDALRSILARHGQNPRDARHLAVKRRIEARDLRNLGMPPRDRLDQLDLDRQMFRGKRD